MARYKDYNYDLMKIIPASYEKQICRAVSNIPSPGGSVKNLSLFLLAVAPAALYATE